MATGGPAASLPATAAAVAARAVAVASLALPLQRPLPTFPTRVGSRLFPPTAFPPKSTPLLLKPLFNIALAVAHEIHSISTGHLQENSL